MSLVRDFPKIDKAVMRFALTMQHKLDKNQSKPCPTMNPDGKGRTWKDCDLHWLLMRLREETLELETALWSGDRDGIIEESGDVGNFAMMVHDIVSACNEQEPAHD